MISKNNYQVDKFVDLAQRDIVGIDPRYGKTIIEMPQKDPADPGDNVDPPVTNRVPVKVQDFNLDDYLKSVSPNIFVPETVIKRIVPPEDIDDTEKEEESKNIFEAYTSNKGEWTRWVPEIGSFVAYNTKLRSEIQPVSINYNYQKTTNKLFDFYTYNINNSYLNDLYNDIAKDFNKVERYNEESSSLIRTFHNYINDSLAVSIEFEGLFEDKVNIVDVDPTNDTYQLKVKVKSLLYK